MSNKVYDEFCKATIPNLTQLDKQVLGHYCTRFNEEVTPARAWPPRAELMRSTGACDKSISRSLGRLSKRGLIVRVTLASKTRGLKGEYAINRSLIRSHIKVTEELPNTSNEVTEQSQKGNSGEQRGNSGVPVMTPSSYPKPIKPIKPRNVSSKHFDALRPLLKDELRYLHGGKNYEEALEALDHKGATVGEVADFLNSQNFANSDNVGGLVAYMLKSFADSYRSSKATIKREWCTYCESPENRIEEFAYEIPSIPEGATSRVCRKCG